jgi:hypothetical protein
VTNNRPATRTRRAAAAAHKALLRADASRELIGQGQQVGADIQQVSFTPELTPVMIATIRSYRTRGANQAIFP